MVRYRSDLGSIKIDADNNLQEEKTDSELTMSKCLFQVSKQNVIEIQDSF